MMTPRHVRNFFIELEIDGKKHKIRTGPNSKSGGFKMTIYQRDRGSVTVGALIRGDVKDDTLQLTVSACEGDTHGKAIQPVAFRTQR